jgi:hypothetical protein
MTASLPSTPPLTTVKAIQQLQPHANTTATLPHDELRDLSLNEQIAELLRRRFGQTTGHKPRIQTIEENLEGHNQLSWQLTSLMNSGDYFHAPARLQFMLEVRVALPVLLCAIGGSVIQCLRRVSNLRAGSLTSLGRTTTFTPRHTLTWISFCHVFTSGLTILRS